MKTYALLGLTFSVDEHREGFVAVTHPEAPEYAAYIVPQANVFIVTAGEHYDAEANGVRNPTPQEALDFACGLVAGVVRLGDRALAMELNTEAAWVRLRNLLDAL